MAHRKGICQFYFIQCKQFSETSVTSHGFQQILDFKLFPECFHGPLKTLWRPHAARGPVLGAHGLRLTH